MAAPQSFPASDRWALAPVHPGAILRDSVLPALGRSPDAVAALLGVEAASFADVLEGAPVTADMAVRLGKLCGNGPDLWLGLQSAYDLANAREAIGADLDAIPTLQDAAA